jgi:hypothetical protein
VFALLTKAWRLSVPVDIQCKLFDKMILPILLYGGEVWVFSNCNQVEVLYRKFLKIVLKVNKSTPNFMVYGEAGKAPLQDMINIRM